MKKNLALAALALVFLLGAAQAQSANSVPDQLKAIQAQLSDLEAQNASLAAKANSNGPRSFYVTDANIYDGNQALSACAAGYHMASLWEIRDPMNLSYNKALGYLFNPNADLGSGPLTGVSGWIRTGSGQSSVNVAGSGNCRSWTSDNWADFGTRVMLNPDWNSNVSVVNPWIATAVSCNSATRVWCVQD